MIIVPGETQMRFEIVAYVVGILLGLSYLIYSLYFVVESVDSSLGHLVRGFLMLALFFGIYKASPSK